MEAKIQANRVLAFEPSPTLVQNTAADSRTGNRIPVPDSCCALKKGSWTTKEQNKGQPYLQNMDSPLFLRAGVSVVLELLPLHLLQPNNNSKRKKTTFFFSIKKDSPILHPLPGNNLLKLLEC